MIEDTPKNRIAKVIAHSGLCSRREAEGLILENRVRLNDELVTTPATFVKDTDKVTVDGNVIPSYLQPRLWIYHKPRGLVTTTKDPQGRPTVYTNLPSDMPRVMSVGRLDMNSEGLLLFTNFSFLSKALTDPQNQVERHYRVRVFQTPPPQTLEEIRKGVTIEGFHYRPCQIEIDQVQGSNCWLNIILTEGKNREIRNILEYFGHPVSRLIRTKYGNFELGDLKPWQIQEVPYETVRSLLEKFGLSA